MLIEPAPDKRDISVDQIRDLIAFAQLTSHQGRARCAIIYPAERMSHSGLNSLLKTLEEPGAGVVLMLICESVSRLPATVVSRCQHHRIAIPAANVALDWLTQHTSEPDLNEILTFAGGSPLTALTLCHSDFAELSATFRTDIDNLVRRQADPVVVAAQWAKQADLALRWLYCFVAGEIRHELTEYPEERGAASAAARSFVKLDQIRDLRRFIDGGVSAELTLTGLLMQWYGAGDPAGN